MTIELRIANTPPADAAERELYPVDTALQPAFDARENDLAIVAGLTQEDRQALQRETIDLVRAIGVSADGLGRQLFDVTADTIIADALGSVHDAALEQSNGVATRQQVLGTYGLKDGEALLARTEKFIQQHPKLVALLQTRGVGSRPDIIVPLVEHVRNINFR